MEAIISILKIIHTALLLEIATKIIPDTFLYDN